MIDHATSRHARDTAEFRPVQPTTGFVEDGNTIIVQNVSADYTPEDVDGDGRVELAVMRH
ncbi:MAG: hypothetical protein R3B90_21690 [Planctomycetaceae bacterium]